MYGTTKMAKGAKRMMRKKKNEIEMGQVDDSSNDTQFRTTCPSHLTSHPFLS